MTVESLNVPLMLAVVRDSEKKISVGALCLDLGPVGLQPLSPPVECPDDKISEMPARMIEAALDGLKSAMASLEQAKKGAASQNTFVQAAAKA